MGTTGIFLLAAGISGCKAMNISNQRDFHTPSAEQAQVSCAERGAWCLTQSPANLYRRWICLSAAQQNGADQRKHSHAWDRVGLLLLLLFAAEILQQILYLQLDLWLKGRLGPRRMVINISYNPTLEEQLTKSTQGCAAAKRCVFLWARGALCSTGMSLPSLQQHPRGLGSAAQQTRVCICNWLKYNWWKMGRGEGNRARGFCES